MSLQCTRCGAPLGMPADYAVWAVRCQYCGFDCELPDRAARQAFAERQRLEAQRALQSQQAAAAQQAAVGQAARGNRLFFWALFGLPTLAVLGAVGFGMYAAFGHASAAIRSGPTVFESTTPPALLALADKAQSSGCPRVIDHAALRSDRDTGTYGMVKAECVRFLAVTPQPAPLLLTITDPTGGVVFSRTAPTGTLDATFCTKQEAQHKVKITGAAEFWSAALGCPRTFGSDPATTGKDKVGARLKELMSHGCYQISYANSTLFDDRKFTTPLDAGTCMDFIAATGVADNEIKSAMSSPFGESIAPLPAPATSIEIPYCAAGAGPHVIEVSSAVNGPYSVAIAICTRKALPKVLPHAGK